MKISRFPLAAALVAAGVFGSVSAFAADTASVSVSASVTGACKFTSGGSLSFTLDPTSTTSASPNAGSTHPTFWCTNGTAYSVSDDLGANDDGTARRMKSSVDATKFIPYSLAYTTNGTGAGKGTPITLTLTSSVANADFINALAGAYTDTVVLSITP